MAEESKEHQNGHALVVSGPMPYYPKAKGNKFIDDLSGISSQEIKTRGMRCNCTGTLFSSKAGLRQHFKSQTHRVWLGEKRTKILEDYASVQDDAKRANVEAGLARQKILRYENNISVLKMTIAELEGANEDMEDEMNVMREKTEDLERKVDAMNKNGLNMLKAANVLLKSNYKREKKEKEKLKEENDELKKK